MERFLLVLWLDILLPGVILMALGMTLDVQVDPYRIELAQWKEHHRQLVAAKDAELHKSGTDFDRLNELQTMVDEHQARKPSRPWWAFWVG